MSEESNELVRPADLSNAQRGNLAELIFIRKAASLGFAVAKPWAEGERYDAIVRVENQLWRVQVKSVLAESPSRHNYRIRTSTANGNHRSYSAQEIDFLVAYIFQKDLWYVFPATVVQCRKAVCVCPGSKRSPYEKYREAWDLMRQPASVESAAATTELARAAGASSGT